MIRKQTTAVQPTTYPALKAAKGSGEENMKDQGPFNTDDYLALLRVIKEANYRFESFTNDIGEPGVIFLRHDVDKDVAAARRMAEIEYSFGVQATYFFLIRTPLYSLLEPEALEHVRIIAELRHSIGLHCDERRMKQAQGESNEGFDAAVLRELALFEQMLGFSASRAVSFHNPSSKVLGRIPKSNEYISTYDPRFMLPATKYLSDTNATWREGNPLPALRNHQWPRLQLLIHPIWWLAEPSEDRIGVLRKVVENRLKQVDAYLRYSNDVWRSHANED